MSVSTEQISLPDFTWTTISKIFLLFCALIVMATTCTRVRSRDRGRAGRGRRKRWFRTVDFFHHSTMHGLMLHINLSGKLNTFVWEVGGTAGHLHQGRIDVDPNLCIHMHMFCFSNIFQAFLSFS